MTIVQMKMHRFAGSADSLDQIQDFR